MSNNNLTVSSVTATLINSSYLTLNKEDQGLKKYAKLTVGTIAFPVLSVAAIVESAIFGSLAILTKTVQFFLPKTHSVKFDDHILKPLLARSFHTPAMVIVAATRTFTNWKPETRARIDAAIVNKATELHSSRPISILRRIHINGLSIDPAPQAEPTTQKTDLAPPNSTLVPPKTTDWKKVAKVVAVGVVVLVVVGFAAYKTHQYVTANRLAETVEKTLPERARPPAPVATAPTANPSATPTAPSLNTTANLRVEKTSEGLEWIIEEEDPANPNAPLWKRMYLKHLFEKPALVPPAPSLSTMPAALPTNTAKDTFAGSYQTGLNWATERFKFLNPGPFADSYQDGLRRSVEREIAASTLRRSFSTPKLNLPFYKGMTLDPTDTTCIKTKKILAIFDYYPKETKANTYLRKFIPAVSLANLWGADKVIENIYRRQLRGIISILFRSSEIIAPIALPYIR